MTRTCTRCGIEYPLTDQHFYRKKTGRQGFNSRCIRCLREIQREYNSNHKEQNRIFQAKNRDRYSRRRREQRALNPEAERQYQRAYRAANPDKIKAWRQKHHAIRYSNPTFRLSSRMKNTIGKSLQGAKAGRHWESLVGYTVEDLKAHLESQFVKGMSWSNYGSSWHIDHIRPIADFCFTSTEDPDFRICWSLWNLRPLWAKKNISKGAKCAAPPLPLTHQEAS